MSRAPEPHTPDIDIEARRAFAAEGGAPVVLTPDLAAFCQQGVSVLIAACGPGEAPVAGLGCGCRVVHGGRIRLLMMRRGNERFLTVVQRGGGVAATFSQPITHRSIQVKGARAVVAAATGEDREAAIRQIDGLRRELVEIDYPPAFAAAYCTIDAADIVAVDLTLDGAFVQTPGPGAGAELKP
jgi:hypothetical protein